ncbi:unnamed protein product [Allacma fusca]|uniref:BTB domain-containing protein n=1 Tax=Allacma fusca TaxID=39272 RepID=A0A8J2IZJ9_9HEXA|nr:unnamed protein product [Allacma fusca]
MSASEQGGSCEPEQASELIVFLIGDSREEFVVNRELFLGASPKFLQLFIDNSENETIHLRHVEAFTFQQVLNYICMGPQWIYDGDVIQNAPELLRTAHYFQLKDLVQTTSDFLATAPTPWELTSICSIVNVLIDIGEDAAGARTSALEFIAKNVAKLLPTHDFLNLSSEALCEILSRDDLNLQLEIQLFEAVVRWGQCFCEHHSVEMNSPSLTEVLAGPLKLIRFHHMSRQEFEQTVLPTHLLCPEQEHALQSFWNDPDARSSDQAFTSPRKFLREKPRLYVIPEEEEEEEDHSKQNPDKSKRN